MGKRLEDAPLLAAYLKKLQERAIEMAKAGKMPTDPKTGTPYKWIAGRGGNRAWGQADEKTIAIVQQRAGVDITIKTVESPTQTELLIGEDAFAKLCAAYEKETGMKLVTRSPGKPKLVKGDHEKPAISLDEVRAAAKTAQFTEID